LEECRHVGAALEMVRPRPALQGRCVDHGEVQLLVAGAQLVEELESLIDDPARAGPGTVDLVDHDDGLQPQRQRLARHEAGLRHRTLDRIHEEQDAVHHREHALDLATEVRVSGSIDDVDASAAVFDRAILGEDGDAALTLDIVGIHDALRQPLMGCEGAGLPQQAIDEGRLAVIDVRDDRDIANGGFLGVSWGTSVHDGGSQRAKRGRTGPVDCGPIPSMQRPSIISESSGLRRCRYYVHPMLKLTGNGTGRGAVAANGGALIADCHARSIDLLRRNLTPAGILAASPGDRARRRGYTAIFGRDAAICAIGMALSGDPLLERAAAAGLETLGEHQAPNGQIPKFVEPFPGEPRSRGGRSASAREADFWYLGCIDSTLWWLLARDFLERHSPRGPGAGNGRAGKGPGKRSRRAELALQWLLAQEHQRFFLLQQNEASDWADIMPRSGFVLYTNALWYYVKRLYGLPHAAATRANFNGLFHPFSAQLSQYRRAHLLADYVLRGAARRRLNNRRRAAPR